MDKMDHLLMRVGVPPCVKGYRYTRVALRLIKKNPSYIDNITKGLYPAVAAECGTTDSRVERAIRHGVELAFDRMPVELQEKMFGNSVAHEKGRATNREFLAVLLLHLEEGVE